MGTHRHLPSKNAQNTRERQATALEIIRDFARPVTLKEIYERMRVRATFSEVESAVCSLRLAALVVVVQRGCGHTCNLYAAAEVRKEAV